MKKRIFTFMFLVLSLVLASAVLAGDYYILRDQAGKILLTNQKPREGSTVLRYYELEEVTDAEIRAASEREQNLLRLMKIEELTEKTANLTKAINRQSKIENLKLHEPPTVIMGSSVGVTVQPQIVVPKGK